MPFPVFPETNSPRCLGWVIPRPDHLVMGRTLLLLSSLTDQPDLCNSQFDSMPGLMSALNRSTTGLLSHQSFHVDRFFFSNPKATAMPKSQFQAPQLLERARRVLRAPPPPRARAREGLPRRAGPLLPREVAQSPQPRQGEGRAGEILRGSSVPSTTYYRFYDFRHRDEMTK